MAYGVNLIVPNLPRCRCTISPLRSLEIVDLATHIAVHLHSPEISGGCRQESASVFIAATALMDRQRERYLDRLMRKRLDEF